MSETNTTDGAKGKMAGVIEREWQDFKRRVYPGGLGITQDKECRQAFLAGVLVTMVQFAAVSKLPEEEAVKAFEGLQRDVIETVARDRMERN